MVLRDYDYISDIIWCHCWFFINSFCQTVIMHAVRQLRRHCNLLQP